MQRLEARMRHDVCLCRGGRTAHRRRRVLSRNRTRDATRRNLPLQRDERRRFREYFGRQVRQQKKRLRGWTDAGLLGMECCGGGAGAERQENKGKRRRKPWKQVREKARSEASQPWAVGDAEHRTWAKGSRNSSPAEARSISSSRRGGEGKSRRTTKSSERPRRDGDGGRAWTLSRFQRQR